MEEQSLQKVFAEGRSSAWHPRPGVQLLAQWPESEEEPTAPRARPCLGRPAVLRRAHEQAITLKLSEVLGIACSTALSCPR